MLEQIEGSQAVARAVTLCRPGVIAAYPISPQTHIVESLSDRVRTGELDRCDYLMVESEFGAMSACIGAAAAGARTYTATSSQGLLFMAEALFNASGLGLPIVMTVANRAIGAPINIWNDHSDTMSMRDSGWIQLFAESNQEAVDLHVQAYRLAERLSVPVMVCMDGFVLTHAFERVDLPTQEQVDAFLPAFEPQQMLDPDDPVTIGAMVGPEAFEEVRYLGHVKQLRALEEIEVVAAAFVDHFGRQGGGLVQPYRTEDADVVIVAMGSVLGTLEDAVDAARDRGRRVGVVGLTTFRPFPADALAGAVSGARSVVVVEKAFSTGLGGVLATDVTLALGGRTGVATVVAGLGGRPITQASLTGVLERACDGTLEALTFLDLDRAVVDRELARMDASARSGPSAENILRDRGERARGPR